MGCRLKQPVVTPCFDVLEVPVDCVTLREAADRILIWADDDRGRYVCVRDAHGIVQAQDDCQLMSAHNHADMVTPDGVPLVWIGKALGLAVERTCGPELMLEVCKLSIPAGRSHYFYGGREGVAEKLTEELAKQFRPRVSLDVNVPPLRKHHLRLMKMPRNVSATVEQT